MSVKTSATCSSKTKSAAGRSLAKILSCRGLLMGIETLWFRLERVLRIMRQFMPHSNRHIARLETATAPETSTFDYGVVRSGRRTIVVQVHRGEVRVRAPHFVGDAEIRDFVNRHRQWIAGKLAHQAQQAAEQVTLLDG